MSTWYLNPFPSAMDAPIPVSDANEKITFFILSKKCIVLVRELRFNINLEWILECKTVLAGSKKL